ncbi:hypothetical protein ACHAXT_005083 [Thalassiosira profunda]
MLFSSNAASVLALAVSTGHWDVARSLTLPEGEGAASAKKKRLDSKEQPIDLLFEKKRRAATAVEDEEKVAADAAAAADDTDAGILRATAEDKALRGQRGLGEECPENREKCEGLDACDGATGTIACGSCDIKKDSCNAFLACNEAQGDIGKNACNNGSRACSFAYGERL